MLSTTPRSRTWYLKRREAEDWILPRQNNSKGKGPPKEYLSAERAECSAQTADLCGIEI